MEIEELSKKLRALEASQSHYQDTLTVTDRLWLQLNESILLLAERYTGVHAQLQCGSNVQLHSCWKDENTFDSFSRDDNVRTAM